MRFLLSLKHHLRQISSHHFCFSFFFSRVQGLDLIFFWFVNVVARFVLSKLLSVFIGDETIKHSECLGCLRHWVWSWAVDALRRLSRITFLSSMFCLNWRPCGSNRGINFSWSWRFYRTFFDSSCNCWNKKYIFVFQSWKRWRWLKHRFWSKSVFQIHFTYFSFKRLNS